MRRLPAIARRATAGVPDLTASYGWRANLRWIFPRAEFSPLLNLRTNASWQSPCNVSAGMPIKNFVYVLRSRTEPHRPYVGLTADLTARLAAHNAGRCPHTARYKPWELAVSIEFPAEALAIRFEKYLKSGSGRAFAKRHFHFTGDQDPNRPFRVLGQFSDEEVASLATLIRSSPVLASDAGGCSAVNGTWPILSIGRERDGRIAHAPLVRGFARGSYLSRRRGSLNT